MQNHRLRVHTYGFTLIELSMVLIIIGLLAGGILVGRDLIRTAEVRRQVSQIEQLDTAVNVFLGKYNCIPGDCAKAVDFGLGDDGDGDGKLSSANPSNPSLVEPEMINFWVHLYYAGFTTTEPTGGHVPGIDSPPLAMQGRGTAGNTVGGVWAADKFYVSYGGEQHFVEPAWILATNVVALSGDAVGVYPAIDIYRLDSKLDDGKPLTGKMLAFNGNLVPCAAPDGCYGLLITTSSSPTVPASCINDDSGEPLYNIPYEGDIDPTYSFCAPLIKAAF